MPKRKRSEYHSIDRLKKKLKKLERKLARGRRISVSSSDISTRSQDPQGEPIESEIDEDIASATEADTVVPSDGNSCSAGGNLVTSATIQPPPPLPPATTTTTLAVPVAETEEESVTELDDVTLEILGTDPSVPKSYGKNIQKDLAVRYAYLVTSGLEEELRKALLEKYLPPGNCSLIDAPVLNPEIKAAVTEIVLKRDKAIFDKQKQTASAISSISEAITMMLSREDKDTAMLKVLMDTGKLLCDTQYNDSITRRNFILAVLKKELKNQLQQTKIDKFLFSEELPDTLKAAKAIHKSGAELKSTPQQKPMPKKPRPTPAKNWKGPPPSRRPPQPSGTSRTREPAPPKHQRLHSSRASQQTHSSSRR